LCVWRGVSRRWGGGLIFFAAFFQTAFFGIIEAV